MKWIMPIMLAVMVTPLAAAQNDWEALLPYGERNTAAYLVLRLITQEMELIPTESLDQCELIGKEIMKGGKLSKFLKGYKCVPGFFWQWIAATEERSSRRNNKKLKQARQYQIRRQAVWGEYSADIYVKYALNFAPDSSATWHLDESSC